MHILLGILGIVGAAAFWIWRINAAAQAARELGDLAGEAANLPRKMRFRSKAKKRGLDVIDDPREAAAVMLLNAARAGGEVSVETKTLIRREMERAFDIGPDQSGELLSRAAWHSSGVLEPVDVVRRMTDFLVANVSREALADLATLIARIVSAESGPAHEQKLFLLRYRERAGLK